MNRSLPTIGVFRIVQRAAGGDHDEASKPDRARLPPRRACESGDDAPALRRPDR